MLTRWKWTGLCCVLFGFGCLGCLLLPLASFLQCFDTVGWLTRRASGPQKNLCYLSPTFFFQTKRRKKNQLTLSPGKRHLKRGNLRYQTSLPLCNHNTPFTADKPHRLCREIFRILFALAWHTEWSHLLHDVIGDWMICFAATATLQQQLQRRLPMLVNGAENPLNCPFPLEFCHTAGGELSHGNKQHAQEIR